MYGKKNLILNCYVHHLNLTYKFCAVYLCCMHKAFGYKKSNNNNYKMVWNKSSFENWNPISYTLAQVKFCPYRMVCFQIKFLFQLNNFYLLFDLLKVQNTCIYYLLLLQDRDYNFDCLANLTDFTNFANFTKWTHNPVIIYLLK